MFRGFGLERAEVVSAFGAVSDIVGNQKRSESKLFYLKVHYIIASDCKNFALFSNMMPENGVIM